MATPLRALLVEDSEDDAALVAHELRRGGFEPLCERVYTADSMRYLLSAQTWDVVLADNNMPDFSGTDAIKILKESGLDIPLILVTGTVGEEKAVEIMKAGADDFILKNRLFRLVPAVRRELKEAENRRQKKLGEGQIQSQLRRITSLRNIDMAISSSLDLKVTLDVFLDQLTMNLQTDAADVMLFNPHSMMLEFAAGRGFRTAPEKMEVRLGVGIAGRAALERRLVRMSDLSKAGREFTRANLLREEGFLSYHAVPLITKGSVKGLLEVFHRSAFEPDSEWTGFLEALAGQAAIAIDSATLFNALQRTNTELLLAYDETIEGWSRALDYRDKETEGHSQRVTYLTLRIARAMGLAEPDLAHIRRGALLHDIGKLGVPDNILLKPGKLDEDEWHVMKKHPVIAYELLSPIDFLRSALDIPYSHHEKWNGGGYPRGLKAEQIALPARIFSVVDVFDALASDRPYRPAWPEKKIKDYIRNLSGTEFDPKVVEIFFEFI